MVRRFTRLGRPRALDLSDPFDDHRVVVAVRSAVEREAEPPGRFAPRWKEKSVAAKIVEPQPHLIELSQHPREAAASADLARQEVVSLECRIVPCAAGSVDRANESRARSAVRAFTPDER